MSVKKPFDCELKALLKETMLRQELYHPMISHFPIALLTFAPLLHLACYFVKSEYLRWSTSLTLYVGSIFYFMTMYTGDEATAKIKSEFCHLVEIYAHEQTAEYALIALIISLVLDIIARVYPTDMAQKLCAHGMTVSLFVVLYFLIQTAHQGAMLVYERGAAVKTAVSTCL